MRSRTSQRLAGHSVLCMPRRLGRLRPFPLKVFFQSLIIVLEHFFPPAWWLVSLSRHSALGTRQHIHDTHFRLISSGYPSLLILSFSLSSSAFSSGVIPSKIFFIAGIRMLKKPGVDASASSISNILATSSQTICGFIRHTTSARVTRNAVCLPARGRRGLQLFASHVVSSYPWC